LIFLDFEVVRDFLILCFFFWIIWALCDVENQFHCVIYIIHGHHLSAIER